MTTFVPPIPTTESEVPRSVEPTVALRILVAEDEPGISTFLSKGFRSAGYEVEVVEDGAAAAVALRAQRFDLCVLDLGLPERDGYDVLRELRSRGDRTPVIVLTARDEPADTVACFEAGADDYVSKPFRFEELLARTKVRLRSVDDDPQALHGGGVTLDLHAHKAYVDGQAVDLTAREFALAEVFLRHPEDVLDREHLLRTVWGDDVDTGSNVVDVYVLYLRRKIGEGFIKTVRGAGYRLGQVG